MFWCLLGCRFLLGWVSDLVSLLIVFAVAGAVSGAGWVVNRWVALGAARAGAVSREVFLRRWDVLSVAGFLVGVCGAVLLMGWVSGSVFEFVFVVVVLWWAVWFQGRFYGRVFPDFSESLWW